MVCSLLSVTAIGLLLQRPPLLGQVRVASRAARPPRAALQMMSTDPSNVPPHEYQPRRACEVMFESLALTYGDGPRMLDQELSRSCACVSTRLTQSDISHCFLCGVLVSN